jgi:nucleotide-binding universal stress UspA family protein
VVNSLWSKACGQPSEPEVLFMVGFAERVVMFQTILFPVDRSPEAVQVAETVAKLVKANHSRLTLLSVVEPPTDAADGGMTDPAAIAKLLQNASALFSQQGITAETVEREGKPAFTICDVADEINADLIVMGCRGLGLTDDGANDSVTTRVINLSPCPVLIVP